MQTAYVHLVRLSHRIARWCRLGRPRSRAITHISLAPTPAVSPVPNPKVLHFKRASACAGRSAHSLACAVPPASTKAAVPNLTLITRGAASNLAVSAAAGSTGTVRIHRVGVGASERMALVGRMSDVCAELDRLALRERRCA